jgi:hypothetical protein
MAFSRLDGQQLQIICRCAGQWKGINPVMVETPMLTGSERQGKEMVRDRTRRKDCDAPIGKCLWLQSFPLSVWKNVSFVEDKS